MSGRPLKRSELAVLAVLTQAADERRVCPTNAELAVAANCGLSRTKAVLDSLAERRIISITSSGPARLITIIATGRRTASLKRPTQIATGDEPIGMDPTTAAHRPDAERGSEALADACAMLFARSARAHAARLGRSVTATDAALAMLHPLPKGHPLIAGPVLAPHPSSPPQQGSMTHAG